MSVGLLMTSAVPAVTAQDLELEHAELLPPRETLWVTRLYPHHLPSHPRGPVFYQPGGPGPRV